MRKYCVYLTNGDKLLVNAMWFDWGVEKDSQDLYFYDSDERVIAWFPVKYVMGVNQLESEDTTSAEVR